MEKDQCFMLPKGPPCFVQLGKLGDLLILFPAFKAIYDRTGLKPVVMAARQYATVLEGISYVQPWTVSLDWWVGITEARKIAMARFNNTIVPQFWNDPSNHDDFAIKATRDGCITLQCHGIGWGVDINRWPNFMTSMWDRAGFTKEEMMTLPLVIDRRNRSREAVLVDKYLKADRPNILYNFTGISSPFVYTPEAMAVIREFKRDVHMVDLGRIRADRIYDLLGLYDRAAGLITIDTCTLHLAATGTIPYFSYTRDGWCGSYPRGDIKCEVKYSETLNRLDGLRHYLESVTNLAHA